MPEKEPWKKDEEEEEEEELDETKYLSQTDAVLFAIDVSKTMLTLPPPSEDKKAEKDSPTLAAIKCAYQIMQQRIISSPKDMMGVLLFGTEKSKFQDEDASSRGGIQYPHCYLLNDLNVPDISDVKTLKNIVEDTSGLERDILEPTNEPVSMSNMLFCANQIFTTRAPNFGSRRLFIITDKDDPHATDKNLRNQAEVRAKDLWDLGVIIELFPISHPDHDFDRTKFYDDIMYRDTTEGPDLAIQPTTFKSHGDGISLLSTLTSDVNSKQVAKRALFSHLPFEIGEGLKISVKGYNILQKQAIARTNFIYSGGESLQLVEGETTKYTEGAAAREVTAVEIKKAYKFGGTDVIFTPEEQNQLKDFGPPVLRIIGFKPRSMLKIQYSVKKSTFIYPSEEDFIGSTRVFAALWKKLVKSKIIGIAWFISRVKASPLLVAILPSEERFDSNNIQVIPAGLWLYPLPFADDLRPPQPVPKPLVASDELTNAMQKAIKQLQLPGGIYNPKNYPNPSLQWLYQVIQAIALEDEVPDVKEDKTMPKFRQIDKRAGEFINEWGQILEREALEYQKSRYGRFGGTDVKRGSDDDGDSGPPRKRIKAEKSDEGLADMSVENLHKLVERDTLKKYSVTDLKDWLKVKGLNATGKKADLLERIEQWIEEH